MTTEPTLNADGSVTVTISRQDAADITGPEFDDNGTYTERLTGIGAAFILSLIRDLREQIDSVSKTVEIRRSDLLDLLNGMESDATLDRINVALRGDLS